MNRLGQLLLVFGLFFMGLVVFHAWRRGVFEQTQVILFVAGGVATGLGALIVYKTRGAL